MARENADKTRTTLTLPNHHTIKGSTLKSVCTQAGVTRDEFLNAYDGI